MASQAKSRTKSGSSKKSKISTKVIAAIIVGIVAIAGIAIVFNSFASGPPAYRYSFYTTCTADKKTTTVKSDLGSGNVTVGWDTKSACLKDSAEEQAYRLNRAVTNEQPPKYPTNYDRYKEYVQKLSGDRLPPPDLVPQSFLDQFKDKSDAEFVTQVFKNVLYRTPGDNGASWAADMRKNGWSRKDAVFIISSSPEAKNKNIGRFTEFLRNNPNPISITPVAQNAQNARDEEVRKIIEPGMGYANYAILILRNEINAAGSYAKAKPKQEEASRIMIDFGKAMEKVNDLYAKSLTANKDQGIDIGSMIELKKRADNLLASSWTGAVEAGQRTEKYRVDEENARIAAANRARSGGSGGSGGGGGGGGGGGQCRAPDPKSEFRTAPTNTAVIRQSTTGSWIDTYKVYQIRTRPGICVNGKATHGNPGPWRETSKEFLGTRKIN
jgi:hypothetical protein